MTPAQIEQQSLFALNFDGSKKSKLGPWVMNSPDWLVKAKGLVWRLGLMIYDSLT